MMHSTLHVTPDAMKAVLDSAFSSAVAHPIGTPQGIFETRWSQQEHVRLSVVRPIGNDRREGQDSPRGRWRFSPACKPDTSLELHTHRGRGG